jgi:hypothetical protein
VLALCGRIFRVWGSMAAKKRDYGDHFLHPVENGTRLSSYEFVEIEILLFHDYFQSRA